MRIGDLAMRSGVSIRSLRYYEEQGLLEAGRTAGGQRVYADDTVERVRLIQQLFAAGIPSRVMVDLLPCVTTGRATVRMLTSMERQRETIAARIRELSSAQERLEHVIRSVREAGVYPDESAEQAFRAS